MKLNPEPISANHLEQSTRRMHSQERRLHSFMDHADPQDEAFWDTVMQLNLQLSGSSFAAQQEFKIEHFLAKNLISSI
jgi:hypothetical protein